MVGYFAGPTSVLSDMSGRSDGIGRDCNGWRLIVLVMFMLLYICKYYGMLILFSIFSLGHAGQERINLDCN